MSHSHSTCYESHWKHPTHNFSPVIDHLFNRITDRARRRDVVLVLSQAKAFSQKRPHLLKLGLPRMLIDEMEILSEDIGKPFMDINVPQYAELLV